MKGLPKSFKGDPDPRHREHYFGGGAPLVTFTDMIEAAKGLTSPLEKRCIADVIAKSPKGLDGREKLSRAYAICRSSLQKSGRIKKGGTELTKVGKKRQSQRVQAGQHKQKLSKWKAAVVAARKK